MINIGGMAELAFKMVSDGLPHFNIRFNLNFMLKAPSFWEQGLLIHIQAQVWCQDQMKEHFNYAPVTGPKPFPIGWSFSYTSKTESAK
jgi:hypothetical protein